MGAPTRDDLDALRRVARYLSGAPRLLYHYPWRQVAVLDVFADSDFAEFVHTRKAPQEGASCEARMC